jgi:hypothetical protein
MGSGSPENDSRPLPPDSQQHVNDSSSDGFPATGNGAFAPGKVLSPNAFLDGLSNTAFLAERTTGSGADVATMLPMDSVLFRSPVR